jgi:hypothetical protein
MPRTLDTLAQELAPLIAGTQIKLTRAYCGIQVQINPQTQDSEQLQVLPPTQVIRYYEVSYSARMCTAKDTLLDLSHKDERARSQVLLNLTTEAQEYQRDEFPDHVPITLSRNSSLDEARLALLSILAIFNRKIGN